MPPGGPVLTRAAWLRAWGQAMPKKKPPKAPATGSTPSGVVDTPSPPRPSLLERIRLRQTFHSPARERLMATDEGKEAYASVRMELTLEERVRLFEAIVTEALREHQHEAFLISKFGKEAPAAQVALHRELLAPLIPRWERMRAEIEQYAGGVEDVDVGDALTSAAAELRRAAAGAADGDRNGAAEALFETQLNLERTSRCLDEGDAKSDAARFAAMAEAASAAWPSASAMDNVTTPSFHDGVAAGERSRDYKAIARWLAPELGRACVASALDPTVIREVGNTLSRAGGGLPHLARVWPEQRARIQVLADHAAGAATRTEGAESTPADVASAVVPGPPSWKSLYAMIRREVEGEDDLEEIVPSSPEALRKAAGRGRSPWGTLQQNRSFDQVRQILAGLRTP